MVVGIKDMTNEAETATGTVQLKDVEYLEKDMVQADEPVGNTLEEREKSESDGEKVTPSWIEAEKVPETPAAQEDVSTEEITNESHKSTPKQLTKRKRN